MDENNTFSQQPVQSPVPPQAYAAPQQAYVPQPENPQPASQIIPPAGNPYGYQPPVAAPVKIRSPHPVLNAVKNLGSSPLFLVAVIAFSVMVLFKLLDAFVNTSSMYALLAPFENQLREFGISLYELNYYLSTLQNSIIVWKVIALIPTILLAVGMWMTFASAQESRTGGMKTAGLTLIKVLSILSLVSICFLTALLMITAIIVLITMIGDAPDYLVGVVAIVAFITAIVLALMIVYYAKIVSTINAMKQTITTGVASDKISSYVGVISILAGAFSVLSIFNSGNALNLIAILGSATASIAFGIFLFRYRTTMRGFLNVYAQPVPTAVPTPAAASAPTYAPSAVQPTSVAPQPQAETAFCPFCGQAHSAADTTCPHCGKPLA